MFLALLFLQGCSFVNELLIVNGSRETIVVLWRFGDKSALKLNGRPRCFQAIINGDKCEIKSDTLKYYCRIEGDSVWYAELPASGALAVAEGLNQDLTNDAIRNDMVSRMQFLKILTPNDKEFSCSGNSCASSYTSISKARAILLFR
jgi:hypothetical protein